MRLHPLTWLIWVLAVAALLSLTRNPLYLGLILLWITLIYRLMPPPADSAPLPFSPLKFGLVVVPISTLFNMLTVHIGVTELTRLPAWLPLLGGPLTMEAATFGALNGLMLTGLFAAFSLLNRQLPVHALIRLIPQAFYPLAVVTAIAITFVPVTLRQFHQIREAQALRGHRLRGIRDWLPLLIPLLIGGLERAMQLAESLTARGFASSQNPMAALTVRLPLIIGLSGLLGGWLLQLVWDAAMLGGLLLVSSIVLIGFILWRVGQQLPRTHYRPHPWQPIDWLISLSLLLIVLIFLLPLPDLIDRSSIFYYPYPRLSWPTLHPLLTLLTCGLLSPIIKEGERPAHHGRRDAVPPANSR